MQPRFVAVKLHCQVYGWKMTVELVETCVGRDVAMCMTGVETYRCLENRLNLS